MATRTLLLADGNTTTQRIVRLTFATEDVRVLVASDGDEAAAMIVAERPDLVLADTALPKRDGYELSSLVSRDPSLAHVPVLLLAGAFEPVDEARAQTCGCAGVLPRPFDPLRLVALVRTLLEPAGPAREPAAAPLPPAAASADVPAALPPDDYFDRLDAALGDRAKGVETLSSPAGDVAIDVDALDIGDLPTVDGLLAGDPPPVPAPDAPTEAGVSVAVPSTGGSFVAAAFNALLAAEHGHQRLLGPEPPVVPADEMEAIVADATRQVLARLAEDGDALVHRVVGETVTRVVSEVAERLVRDEIRRIRAGGTPPSSTDQPAAPNR